MESLGRKPQQPRNNADPSGSGLGQRASWSASHWISSLKIWIYLNMYIYISHIYHILYIYIYHLLYIYIYHISNTIIYIYIEGIPWSGAIPILQDSTSCHELQMGSTREFSISWTGSGKMSGKIMVETRYVAHHDIHHILYIFSYICIYILCIYIYTYSCTHSCKAHFF